MESDDLLASGHALLRGLDILDGMVDRMEHGERIEVCDASVVLNILRLHEECYAEERDLAASLQDTLKEKRGVVFVRDSRRLSLMLRDHLAGKGASVENQMGAEINSRLTRLEQKYAPKADWKTRPTRRGLRKSAAAPPR